MRQISLRSKITTRRTTVFSCGRPNGELITKLEFGRLPPRLSEDSAVDDRTSRAVSDLRRDAHGATRNPRGGDEGGTGEDLIMKLSVSIMQSMLDIRQACFTLLT
jgi:hypothetical protein